MRAIGFTQHGGPEVLQMLDLPEIHAKAGQVRIRVAAAAVNPTDVIRRTGAAVGGASFGAFPLVPGMDVAGIVDELGPNVPTRVRVGDHVMGLVVPDGTHGAYREQLVLDALSLVPIPKGTSLVEASTLPMNGLTARQSLDLLGLEPGQVLCVTGGAGAYGGYVVQLAKIDGLTVIADAAPSDEELLRDLGADIVVPRGEGLAERIRQQFPDGVDAVADGAMLAEAIIPAVRDGGAFTAIRGYRGTGERGIHFTQTWVSRYDRQWDKLNRLRQQVEDGLVTLRVAGTYPPDQAADAHRKLEAGGTRGRLVIAF